VLPGATTRKRLDTSLAASYEAAHNCQHCRASAAADAFFRAKVDRLLRRRWETRSPKAQILCGRAAASFCQRVEDNAFHPPHGLGCGVGRALGIGLPLGVGVARGVEVAVAVGVGVGVAHGVSVYVRDWFCGGESGQQMQKSSV
jgi:hypothetical protein